MVGQSCFTTPVLGGLTFTFQQGQETGNQTKERKAGGREEPGQVLPTSLRPSWLLSGFE